MLVNKPVDSGCHFPGFAIQLLSFPEESFHTPKFSCSLAGLAVPQLCQAFSRYPFTCGSQVWGMEVAYLPNIMKAMGCSFVCPVASLTPSSVQQKQDGLPVESHVSGHQSYLMGRQYSFNPCLTSMWRIQCPFHHIDPHDSRTSSHTRKASAQTSTATVSLQIPQPQTTR